MRIPTICLLLMGMPICHAVEQADAPREETAPATSSHPEATRTKSMGPDVKLANPLRYRPPPVPLSSLPRVTPNKGVGPNVRVLHYRESEDETLTPPTSAK
ncbi:hypothetical protein [Ruficoccus sp. ZRK36]|uniref:hypothetical protein n=1 Tax=Ruficoccus sp. ZRK36 TaxID=2866311 RepID=UPI001C72F89F|nr:hypothetical protein [Ruficoccus sp. ZRK36]QYY35134.1 hypothetical protein K0V07_12610 [Ruficoccus sp. ZRK36]